MCVCMIQNSVCHLISTNFTSLSNNIFLGRGPAAGDNTDIVSCSMLTPILSRRQSKPVMALSARSIMGIACVYTFCMNRVLCIFVARSEWFNFHILFLQTYSLENYNVYRTIIEVKVSTQIYH